MEVVLISSVIAIPIYFFWKWVFKKIFSSNTKRQIATWVATIVITPLAYNVLIILYFSWLFYTPVKDFNRSEWMANSSQRFQMADDLINSKLLMARDTGEVKQMLGMPSGRLYQQWRSDTINTWIYTMGQGGGGLGFLFHDLYLRFDNGKVSKVEHIEMRD